MRLLRDTTTLYVAAGVSDLGFTLRVQRLLEHSDTIRYVSRISFIEIAIKANSGSADAGLRHGIIERDEGVHGIV